eukprot:GHVO01002981.1.p2 GENE.GHVO01002981.1~~GHVO01002981.1.p2  ORF type:complete len:276 (+),score=12.48 GHVO01002981.1:146-973(+)
MTKLALILLPLMAWIISPVFSFPDGAPISSCGFLYPKHGKNNPQSSPSPFTITVSPLTYNPGDDIQVDITATDPKRHFTGFVMKARRVEGNTEELLGVFSDIVEDDIAGLSWYPKTDGAINCLTHINKTQKNQLSFTWITDENVGDVIFMAAFVENYATFWTAVNSTVVKADQVVSQEKYSAQAEYFEYPSTEIRAVSEGCGMTKGCFLYPRFCSSVKCTYAVSYEDIATNHVKFEMFGESKGYVSLGLSKDTLMGDDITFTCYMKDGVGSIQFG